MVIAATGVSVGAGAGVEVDVDVDVDVSALALVSALAGGMTLQSLFLVLDGHVYRRQTKELKKIQLEQNIRDKVKNSNKKPKVILGACTTLSYVVHLIYSSVFVSALLLSKRFLPDL